MDSAYLSLTPLGVPLQIELEKASQLAAVEAACVGWSSEPDPSTGPLRLQLRKSQSLHGTGDVSVSTASQRLNMHGKGVTGWVEGGAARASCEVSAEYLAAPEQLREEVLETLVLFLLAQHGRAPTHAAGVLVDGVAVLLCGQSGSGKSSLALAADRQGLQVVSEDTVHIQVRPALSVWGWPRAVHLLPADAPDTSVGERVRGGRRKLVVPIRSGQGEEPVRCNRAVVCLLGRGDALDLAPLSPGEAMVRLARLEPGFDLFADEIGRAHAALTANGAWQLTLSSDPNAAVRFLLAQIDGLRETSVP